MKLYWRLRRDLLRLFDRLGQRQTYFRAVSIAEYESLVAGRGLAISAQGSEGKHLAATYEAACEWGRRLHGAGAFRVIGVSFPASIAASFYSWTKLDGIGAAAFAEQGALGHAILTLRVD